MAVELETQSIAPATRQRPGAWPNGDSPMSEKKRTRARRRPAVIKTCPVCGDNFKAYVSQERKTCSVECANIRQTGPGGPTWAGGVSWSKGYRLLYVGREHPMSNCDGYAYEHRLVMAEHLGRYLDRDEHIHHINEVKSDNRIENLELTNLRDHMSFHRQVDGWAKHFDECVACGTSDSPHCARGMCRRCYHAAWRAEKSRRAA